MPMNEMQLFERLGPQKIRELWRSIYYRVRGDQELAKDIMQDAILKAIESVHQLRDDEKLDQWISVIAKNKCYEHLKKQSHYHFRNQTVENDTDYDIFSGRASPSAEDIAMLRFDIEERYAFVESQPKDIRQIIFMHGIDNMTFDEIGKALRMPPETVKTKYYRAIKKFKEKAREVAK